jgi:hypothetical protein
MKIVIIIVIIKMYECERLGLEHEIIGETEIRWENAKRERKRKKENVKPSYPYLKWKTWQIANSQVINMIGNRKSTVVTT